MLRTNFRAEERIKELEEIFHNITAQREKGGKNRFSEKV